MSIPSIYFLLFTSAFLVLYFVVPGRIQWLVILIADIVFFLSYGVRALIYALAIGLLGYLGGLLIGKKRSRAKLISGLAVGICLAVWFVVKLFSTYDSVLIFDTSSIILPVGLSFYSFIVASYVIDVKRKKVEVEKNPLRFYAMVLFFPHIIQGPFSRVKSLRDQFFANAKHHLTLDNLGDGGERIIWGLVKKVIIAENLGIVIGPMIADPEGYPGFYTVFAVVMYGFQLYADFSGYMDIMCGICRVMGIELAENFEQPYLATSVSDYWRRWHISLGDWYKDYLFFPVATGKPCNRLARWLRRKELKKASRYAPTIIALFCVWVMTGLWHGISINYFLWGMCSFVFIALGTLLEGRYDAIRDRLHIKAVNPLWRAFCIVRTFILISLFRVFSLGGSLEHSFSMFRSFARVTENASLIGQPMVVFEGLSDIHLIAVAAALVLLIVLDILQEAGVWTRVKGWIPYFVRGIFFALLVIAIVLFGPESNVMEGFMYANF